MFSNNILRRLILAGLLALCATSAQAAIAVTACGIANDQVGSGTDPIVVKSTSTGAANIPAGAVIIVAVAETGVINTGSSTLVDSASNSYTFITKALFNTTGASGSVGIYYSTTGNALALTGAGTLTYTTNASGTDGAISCMYATGLSASPLDSAVTATATGSTGTITVTSGTPTAAGDLFVGIFGNNNISNFTQDTGNGWAVPPTRSPGNGSVVQVDGGTQVNAGSGTLTYAPTVVTKGAWGILTVGFKAFGAAATVVNRRTLMGVGQ